MNFANYTASGEPVPEGNGPSSPFLPSNPTILAADCPLIVPMQLKISLMRLRAIVVLIVSRSTGVTLSFKTDPLESVLVSSTFDSFPSVRRHLQMEIENRLRDLFQKELPAMIHSLSNDWLKRSGLNRRGEDSRDVLFASTSPESVSALFPAPNRTLSPPSVAGKNSAPPPRLTKTPKSQKSTSASIAAQSAPAEFAHAHGNLTSESCGIVALVPAQELRELPEVFDLVIRESFHPRQHQSCYSEIGILPVEQYYFRSHRSIIVRAPTDLALPDPILIESGKLFRRKPVNIGKLFRSLFKINEIEGEDVDKSSEIVGLKAIEGIGMGLAVSGVSSVKSSLILPDNFSVRSRSRSMLLDPHLNKALSTISGNRYSRFHNNYAQRSEADPDLVQFEPDEFRSSDYALRTILDPPKMVIPSSRTLESLDGESKSLAVKFGIMRRLQSTLATNNFVETNILYRTQSARNKK